MNFVERIRAHARERQSRIVFPESGDPRIIAAVKEIISIRMAIPIMLTDEPSPLEHAHSLVANGDADACVAGAVYTTAEVLRSALKNVGLAPGVPRRPHRVAARYRPPQRPRHVRAARPLSRRQL